MIPAFLSDLALRDIAQFSEASICLAELINLVEAIEGLYLHAYTNIKRLKGIRPTAWRHRNGDYRTIFTTTKTDSEDALIIHRIAHRKVVYKRLPEYLGKQITINIADLDEFEKLLEDPHNYEEVEKDLQYQDSNRHYRLKHHLLDNTASAETITNYIFSGQYYLNPILTSQQESLPRNVINQRSQIHKIQGAAGTGKTTFAFHLADAAISHWNYYPIIVVPNLSLQRFGVKNIAALDKNLKVCTSFPHQISANTQQDTQLAIFTRDDLIKYLSGDDQVAIRSSEGNRLIRQVLSKTHTDIQADLQKLNLYAIHQGLLQNEGYQESSKDELSSTQQEAIKFLKNYKSRIDQAFKDQDAISQARRAYARKDKFAEVIKSIAGEQHIMLIIDEVQDFFWLQLDVLLQLATKNNAAAVVLLGDENQRVTLSGFSWTAFHNTYKNKYDLTSERPLTLDKNFRNTKSIARASKYILSAYKDKLKNAFADVRPSDHRHGFEPPDPDTCFEEGIVPRLIEADQAWMETVLQKLSSQDDKEPETESSKFVFILNNDSNDLNWLLDQLNTNSNVITYTIEEAKGQEFEAVIMAFPFAEKKEKPSVDDLYNWYTALTRARRYEAVIVSPKEMQWLKREIQDFNLLQQVFCIEPNLSPDSFVKELTEEGKNLITAKQLQEKFIHNLVKELIAWLKGGNCPRDLTIKCIRKNLNIWEVAELIEIEIDTLLYEIDLTTVKLQTLEGLPAPEALALYSGARPMLLASRIDTGDLDEHIVQQLEEYFNANKECVAIAKEKITSPLIRYFILRATGNSWEAAYTINRTDRKQLIENIAKDLERQGLPYEATRLKVQLLSHKHPENCLFPDVVSQPGMLVDLLCDTFIDSLPKC